MTREEICARIPHQGRMCLLDRLEEWDDTRIVCLAGSHHDPDHPLRTSAGLHALCAIEYAAQAMALHGSLREPQGPDAPAGYLASVRDVRMNRERLDREAGPLRIEAERLGGDARAFIYAFRVSSEGGLVVSGRVVVQQTAGGKPARPEGPGPEIAVVIPAYNEAATIREVAERARRHCGRVIVVDDGSVDDTAVALDGSHVTLLRHAENQGKAAALWRGMSHAVAAGASAIITIDGDGQHDPDDIARLVEAAASHPGHVVVAVRRLGSRRAPWLRRFANRFADFWLSWSCGQALADCQSGFRLYPAELLRGIDLPRDRDHGFVFESEILIEAAWRGFPVFEVPVRSVYRPEARASHFRHVDTWRITRMVAGRLIRRNMYFEGLRRAYGQRHPGG